MTEGETTLIREADLPFHRWVRLQNIAFVGGLNMLRLTFKERKRFTMIDLDKKSAEALAQDLLDWAAKQEE